jgi:glycine oxidase
MTACIVVGGGLVGMLTARYLHEEGLRVLLLERGQLGRESSWAGGGILSPLYPWRYPAAVTHLAKLSQRLYPQLAAELEEETGIDPQWIQNGLLILDQDERKVARIWCGENGIIVERLDEAALQRCEPALSRDFIEGLWMPTVAQIRNPRLLKALRVSLEQRRIPYRLHTMATKLAIRDGHIEGVQVQGETIESECVLLAGGAWSPHLIPETVRAIDVKPVRGQMILFQARPETLQRIVLYKDHYLIPRLDGRILAGSTLEYVGYEHGTTEEAHVLLRRSAVQIMPSISNFPIEYHWSGLHPSSPSGIPYIGKHPETKGLFLNCGHFRNGVVLGLASARLAADLILGKSPTLPAEPYGVTAIR